ncbi:hypothetical protein ABZ260_06975 [Streptosporangium sp. NPDC006013]|uniref:hypothetical protein n=1 Tax=Streptosporangium sp. NPDC006013 TaxID=3155596 RepID=UPI0033BB3241
MAVGMLATPAAAASGSGQTVAAVAKPKPKPAVWAGTPKASPSRYEGECPVKVTFSSKIKVKAVKAKTTVAYRWLRGDGSKGKVQTFTLRGKGVKSFTVKEKATFKGDVKGWQAIQLLAPRAATSAKGYFSVSCGAGEDDHEVVRPGVGAQVWVDEGNCQATLIGRINTSDSRWVRYQWVVNGRVVDRDAVRVNGSRKVFHVIKPHDDFRGWAALEIIDPVETSSNRAYFKIWCKDTSPRVEASVDSLSDYKGTCPVSRTFTGAISVSHGGTVKYRWVRDGVAGDWQNAYFSGHGSQRQIVSDTWTASASGDAKRAIEIYGGPTSGTVVGKVTCEPAPAQTPAPDATLPA